MQELDAVTRNTLASLLDATSIKMIQVPAFPEPREAIICEAGDGTSHTRWAVEQHSARAPGGLWGRGEASRVVKTVDQGPLVPLSGKALDGSQLRMAPNGTVFQISVTTDWDGPISQFGTHFWSRLVQEAEGCFEPLKAKGPLTRITYRDRYLSSPLTIRLLFELLSGLKIIPALLSPKTCVSIVTAELNGCNRAIPQS